MRSFRLFGDWHYRWAENVRIAMVSVYRTSRWLTVSPAITAQHANRASRLRKSGPRRNTRIGQLTICLASLRRSQWLRRQVLLGVFLSVGLRRAVIVGVPSCT